MRHPRKRRSTPHGEHRPVLLREVLQALDPQPGMWVIDCTVGWAGHSAELVECLQELGDEPQAERIAAAIVRARGEAPIKTTKELANIIQQATKEETWRLHPTPGKWNLHPAARTFQALRILVNRELANLEQLLRLLPAYLKPGGRAAIVSFHSGEDRLVKSAFRDGLRAGVYAEASGDPVRAEWKERMENPRARSAKLRWARRAGGRLFSAGGPFAILSVHR